MKIRPLSLMVALVAAALAGACGASGSPDVPSIPSEYTVFGQTLSNAIPTSLKEGGVNANVAAIAKALSGACAADYTDCPYLTASGGGDSSTGEILMRLWGLDYQSACTSALFADGTCFECVDCDTGSVGINDFIKPTMLANPGACATTSTSSGRYVNLGVDPCFFGAIIAQIGNFETCKTVQGGAVDISSAVPWYASWGMTQTVNFSSYYAKSGGGGIWWTINNGASGNQQYFLSLDSNWLYEGMKDTANDTFLFLGTGSPAYYASIGEGSGVNISAYAGTLSAIPAQFEAIQVRVQDPNKYIERMKSNGSHLWYESWSGSDFPETPDEVAGVRDNPTSTRCVQIGASVVTSKYVPLTDCVTSFGVADVAALNRDDTYTLRVIDGQTAGSVSFSTALTPSTSSTCLQE